jgi:hypothetical protein
MKPLAIMVPDNTGKRIRATPVGAPYLDRSYYIPQRKQDLECTGCGALVTVFVWSFHGSGKNCPQCHGRLVL